MNSRDVGLLGKRVGAISLHGENVRLFGKALSPYKGSNRALYQETESTVLTARVPSPELDAALDEAVQALDRIVLTQAINDNPYFAMIKRFIETFLSDPENMAVARTAYLNKLNDFSTRLAEEIAFWESLQAVPDQQLRDALSGLDAEKLRRYDELGKLAANADRYELDELIDECHGVVESGLAMCAVEQARLAKKRRDLSQVSDPMCVSFMVLEDTESSQSHCLIGVSSPEKNRDFLEALSKFVQLNEDMSAFSVAEEASDNFCKLLYRLTQSLTDETLWHPKRACAEKSLFSTLAKLMRENPNELSAIKVICNFGFYPKACSDLAQAKAKEEVVLTVGDSSQVSMKLIKPCDDCFKIMPSVAAVLTHAAEGGIEVSPWKRSRSMGEKTASSSPVTRQLFR